MDDALLESLLAALAGRPDDLPLRLHVADQLLAAGRHAQAVGVVAPALAADPTDARIQALMQRALAGPPATTPETTDPPFDWGHAEAQLDGPPPAFVETGEAPPAADAYDLELPTVTLADVGGMEAVKERLDAAFLAPMRNPELRRLYGKSLRGGLLLYGPPGVGKTFLARAVAGELGAGFVSIGLADVLSRWLGESERALHELFQLARRSAPCVVFIDELDALGGRRSQQRTTGLRTMVNSLLTELDGVEAVNEGVFVLAATNQPWDVDPALRRPGRLDRTVLVTPPDAAARRAILETHLRDRPLAGIDLGRIAERTNGFSGADLAHVCETASERALLDSARSGTVRLIDMRDVDAALAEIRPSIGPWLDTARTVVSFGDDDGTYADLRAYLREVRRL
ncbi:ATP-binding protein [Jatrophihabitans sp. YIM 134969]